MKAIWRGELYSITKDDGNGVYIIPIDSDDEEAILYVDYSWPSLILDPTDQDLEDMSVDNAYI